MVLNGCGKWEEMEKHEEQTDKAVAPVDGVCRPVLSTECIGKICKWRYGIVQMVDRLIQCIDIDGIQLI